MCVCVCVCACVFVSVCMSICYQPNASPLSPTGSHTDLGGVKGKFIQVPGQLSGGVVLQEADQLHQAQHACASQVRGWIPT